MITWPDKIIHRLANWRDATFYGVVLVGALVVLGVALVFIAFARVFK